MSIRITQSMMYDKYTSQMQGSLSAYMESSEQGSTQKKINKPSDDPAGIYKVLTLRRNQSFNTQLLENCDTAKGWLKLEDSILSTQMPMVVTTIKSLAEQAATGTYTAEQRRDIAYQVRQQFGSLINMANSEFDGKSLFAGHKYDSQAFHEGLAMMSQVESVANLVNSGKVTVEGDSEKTIALQFTEDGSLDSSLAYRWTDDGGTHWNTGVSSIVTDGTDSYTVLDCDGVTTRIKVLEDGSAVTDDQGNVLSLSVPATDISEQGVSSSNGTLYIRPAAIYQGDVNDTLEVVTMGTNGNVGAEAQGTFGGNTLIRLYGIERVDGIEQEKDLECVSGALVKWEYSTDNGLTWVSGRAKLPDGASESSSASIRLPLPEGYVDLTITGTVPKGGQVMVHPEDANVGYEIMKDTYITVNGVGKDIFGGYYNGKPALQELDDPGRNLFEVVGNFIGYLETNNQSGCQETLAKLAKAEEYILTQATRVGGLENRVDVAYDVLTSQKLDIGERLSYVEDIDLTELLVKMEQQQITYQTVLQSASKIMNMRLANYL